VREVLRDEPGFAATLAPAPPRAAVLTAIHTGLKLRAGQLLLPFWFHFRAKIISRLAVDLAASLRRRERHQR
jgi:hypothetical protein